MIPANTPPKFYQDQARSKGLPLTPFMKAVLKKFVEKRLRVHKKIQKTLKLAAKMYYESFKVKDKDNNAKNLL